MCISEVECRRRVKKADEAWVCEIVGRRTLLNEVAGDKFGESEEKACGHIWLPALVCKHM